MTSLVMLNLSPAPTSAEEALAIAPMPDTNETPSGPVFISKRRTHGPMPVPGYSAEAGVGYLDPDIGGMATPLYETFQGPIGSGIAAQPALIFQGSVPTHVITAVPSIRGNVGKSNDGGVAARSAVDTTVPDNESVLAAFLNPALRKVLGR